MHPINTFIKKRTLQTKIHPFKTSPHEDLLYER